MPLEKQSLNNFLPNGFETLNQEGYKENFSEDKIATGYEKDVPDIVSGPNLNNLIDVVGKNTNILNNYVEYLNGMPINNVPTVNKAGQLDYVENNFSNKNQITNCILEAPNGLASFSGSVLTLKSGIKYLTGIGRNTDLSFKTAEYTTESERNLTFQPVQDGFAYVYILNGYPNYCPVAECYFIDNDPGVEPTGKSRNNQVWFDLWNNEIYHSSNGSTEWVKVTNFAIVGKAYFSSATSSTITAFRAELPVELLQRKNKAEISGWGMSSNKYIDLTLGASGSTYTAPANGWVSFSYTTKTAHRYIALENLSANWGITSWCPVGYDNGLGLVIPVLKQDVFRTNYTTDGSVKSLKFYYAEGEV